jgi:hypothetical protein
MYAPANYLEARTLRPTTNRIDSGAIPERDGDDLLRNGASTVSPGGPIPS